MRFITLTIFLLATSLLFLPVAQPQMIQVIVGGKPAVASCSTPTGTTLTESFGDSTTSCWTSGPSTCNNTWTIGDGTAHSIITSPSGASDNTACSNSLQFAYSGGSEYILKSVTGKDVNTAVDLELLIRFSAWTIASYDAAQVLTLSQYTDLTGFRLSLNVYNAGGTYKLRAGGTGSSDDTTSLSLNTWYLVNIHLETGTNASSISVNSNTPTTFTQGAYNATYIGFGRASSTTNTSTSIVGYLTLD